MAAGVNSREIASLWTDQPHAVTPPMPAAPHPACGSPLPLTGRRKTAGRGFTLLPAKRGEGGRRACPVLDTGPDEGRFPIRPCGASRYSAGCRAPTLPASGGGQHHAGKDKPRARTSATARPDRSGAGAVATPARLAPAGVEVPAAAPGRALLRRFRLRGRTSHRGAGW